MELFTEKELEHFKKEIFDQIKCIIEEVENETVKDEKTNYFYKIFCEKDLDMKFPEKYSILCQSDINMSINMALRKILQEKIENFEKLEMGKKEKIIHLFTNYSFYENHIRNLIEKKTNTFIYLTDRSCSILKTYYNYILDNSIPEDMDEYQWWRPPFGSNIQWINYINSLYNLYHGDNELYLPTYLTLLESDLKEKPNSKVILN